MLGNSSQQQINHFFDMKRDIFASLFHSLFFFSGQASDSWLVHSYLHHSSSPFFSKPSIALNSVHKERFWSCIQGHLCFVSDLESVPKPPREEHAQWALPLEELLKVWTMLCVTLWPVYSLLFDFALWVQQQTVTICCKLKLLITMSVL